MVNLTYGYPRLVSHTDIQSISHTDIHGQSRLTDIHDQSRLTDTDGEQDDAGLAARFQRRLLYDL